MPDIEAMARAAFERLHALASRPRNWDRHPDGDQEAELGRDTFREMARAMYQNLQQQIYVEVRTKYQGGPVEPLGTGTVATVVTEAA